MVEFGLLIALIAVIVAVAATALGQSVAGTLQDVADGLDRCAKLAENNAAEQAQDNIGGWKCHQ